MFNLVLKDIMIQKKSLLFCFGYCFFVLVFFGKQPAFGQSVYIMASVAVSYLLLLGAGTIDSKNNTDLILNSLPLKRSQIVLAKYLTLPVYLVIALLFTLFASVIMRFFGHIGFLNPLTLIDIVASLFGVGFLGSVYLPLFAKFGSHILRYVNVLIFMLAFFLPGFLLGFFRRHPPTGAVRGLISQLQTVPVWAILTGLFIATLLMIFGSLAVSLRIYVHKDLD